MYRIIFNIETGAVISAGFFTADHPKAEGCAMMEMSGDSLPSGICDKRVVDGVLIDDPAYVQSKKDYADREALIGNRMAEIVRAQAEAELKAENKIT